jgi:serine/threonine protein phosphatase PrpC
MEGTMRFDYAARTTCGRRANNEDAVCADPYVGLYAVADGMGGYEGGEIASRIVVDTLHEFLGRVRADAEATWPYGLDPSLGFEENLLSVAVRLASAQISAQRTGPLNRMGSTVALLLQRDERAIIAHVGDSRVYRLRGGVLEALTRDHSLWAEMQAAGVPDLPPLEQCSFRNVITRALGLDGSARPDVRLERLAAGDVYLLCTDGVTEKLDDGAIARRLAAPSAEAACQALVEAAYEAGGRDNITAVVLRVQSPSPSSGSSSSP